MKAVLMSIQPKWCELIASGKKTVEVRKTKPKIAPPFKVYIYCTKDNTFAEKTLRGFDDNGKAIYYKANKGKVIGEFVCDRIIGLAPINQSDEDIEKQACLSREQIVKYLRGKGYGWHIADLVIYERPRELGEFKRVCDGNCQSCQYAIWQTNGWAYEPYIVDCKPITRPPQSWCYCEEVKRDGT